MARWMAQLQFRWAEMVGPAAASTTNPSRSPHEDSALAAWCSEAAKSLGLPELARRVRVCWNPRMRTTAGRAWWPSRAIELNPKLRDCADEELWRTLKHELAHLVAYERSGRRRIEPHGREWQAACADLGIPGETPFHTLPFERRRLKRNYAYACPGCDAVVHRVKPIRRMVACYQCCQRHNGGSYDPRFRLVEKKT